MPPIGDRGAVRFPGLLRSLRDTATNRGKSDALRTRSDTRDVLARRARGGAHQKKPDVEVQSPPGVQLALMPFGEPALRHFMFLERPEGMQLEDAEAFANAPACCSGNPSPTERIHRQRSHRRRRQHRYRSPAPSRTQPGPRQTIRERRYRSQASALRARRGLPL